MIKNIKFYSKFRQISSTKRQKFINRSDSEEKKTKKFHSIFQIREKSKKISIPRRDFSKNQEKIRFFRIKNHFFVRNSQIESANQSNPDAKKLKKSNFSQRWIKFGAKFFPKFRIGVEFSQNFLKFRFGFGEICRKIDKKIKFFPIKIEFFRSDFRSIKNFLNQNANENFFSALPLNPTLFCSSVQNYQYLYSLKRQLNIFANYRIP